MKKTIVFSIALLAVVLLSTVAVAKTQHDNILFNRIVILDEEKPVFTSVTVENNRPDDFRNAKIVALIPELGVRSSHRVDVKATQTERSVLLMDLEDVPEGEYWVRITVSNEDVKRVRHRLITIK